MSEPVFVDTNVLIYSRDRKDAAKRDRAQAWLRALSGAGRIRINLQVLNEFTRVVLARESNRPVAEVRREVDALRVWGDAPITDEIIQIGWEVRAKLGYSWFDCLIVASAALAKCRYLLTEDMGSKAGATFGPVTLVDPFNIAPSALLSSH